MKGASAKASEPRYMPSSPLPTASGAPLRAPIRRFCSPANRKPSAKAPCSRGRTLRTATTGSFTRLSSCVTRCATTSESVSDWKMAPSAFSSSRKTLKFSMIPLWTTATLSVACGWALNSVGLPCVAQRVWPMPIVPASGSPASLAREVAQLALRTPSRDLAILERCDTGGIVAAVFQPLQGVDDQACDGLTPDNPNNSTHASMVSLAGREGATPPCEGTINFGDAL